MHDIWVHNNTPPFFSFSSLFDFFFFKALKFSSFNILQLDYLKFYEIIIIRVLKLLLGFVLSLSLSLSY
jgi:hypothetical protein